MPRTHPAVAAILTLLLPLLPVPAASAEEIGLYDYVFSDRDGKEITLAPYRGRLLVVEFFATWCPPCRRDLPEVAKLQELYPAEKVAFVAVSADGTSNTVRNLPRFLDEVKISIPVLVGGGIFVDQFAGVDQAGSRQIILPQTYLFDGKGEMLMRLVGDQKSKRKNLAAELDLRLKENPTP